MHSRAKFRSSSSSQTYLRSDKIGAPHFSGLTGTIDSFAHSQGCVCYTNTQWIGWPSSSLPQHSVINVGNDRVSLGSSTIDAYHRITRTKPPRRDKVCSSALSGNHFFVA
jgi:hypothetical protein